MFDVPDISIVVPVYGSDGTLEPLYKRIAETVKQIPATFELILVDDGGPGNPWKIINHLAQRDSRVIGLQMSRNFGQHRAIMAGVDIARGNRLVIMDCDLQDRPEEIPRLWAKALEGHDAVIGRRTERKDSFHKRMASRLFHWLLSMITDQKSDAAEANFGIYSRRVVDTVKTSFECPGFFPFLVRRAGFHVAAIDIIHSRRAEGKSSYTLVRKLSLAMDIIFSCFDKSSKTHTQYRTLMTIAVLCFGSAFSIRCFLSDHLTAGWTGIMIPLFFLSGVLSLSMGMLGIYADRLFGHIKEKPLYVVKDRTQMPAGDDSL